MKPEVIKMPEVKPTGGSAFPVQFDFNEQDDLSRQEGMTLRDYFAAHAPIEPTFEFEVIMPEPRPQAVRNVDNLNVYIKNSEKIATWDREKNRQERIQWPYVYADAMIAERNKK